MTTATPDTVLDGVTFDAGGVCHLTCKLCQPVNYPGMLAVCGVELLGIDPVWPDRCTDCDDAWPEHSFTCDGIPK